MNTGKRLVTVHDFQKAAETLLPKSLYDYYGGGANDELTLRRMETAFSNVQLVPRCLRDTREVSVETKILGKSNRIPFLISPTALQKLAHEDGELATYRAASEMGTIMILSSLATTSLRELDEEACLRKSRNLPCAPRWFQFSINLRKEVIQYLVRESEKYGIEAIVVTVDAPKLGQREKDIRNGFVTQPDWLKNFENIPFHSTNLSKNASLSARLASFSTNGGATWDVIDWLASITHLPVILKGILHPDDAIEALRHPISGMIVSNHGGRQLDGEIAAIDALPFISRVVKEHASKYDNKKIEIYMDGGIRRGTDILKALALGAQAVLVGRPVLWGLAVRGGEGVQDILQILERELKLAMSLCGVSSMTDLHVSKIIHPLKWKQSTPFLPSNL